MSKRDEENLRLYENVFIGNFVFALGFSQGRKAKEVNENSEYSINITQQTPLDKSLGDLFGGINGRCFLIEFKRSGNNSKKEAEKIKKLKRYKEIKEISKKCHFFIYINAVSKSDPMIDSSVKTYWEAMEDENEYRCENNDGIGNVEEFIRKIGEGEYGETGEKFGKYVNKLLEIYSDSGTAGGGNAAIMVCNKNNKWTIINVSELERELTKIKQKSNCNVR